MKITVLGSGGWGTALALLLVDNGHEVTLWSHSSAKAEEMRRSRCNPLLPQRSLSEALAVTGDITCVAAAELVVFATPSFAVRATARQAASHLAEGTLLVSVSKGIEKETHLRMSEIIAEETGGRFPIVALSGPSHAEEVARGLPTGCVAACADKAAAERVQDVFMNGRFRVYTSPDIVGVEICGAMKNVVALCCGISDGMGYEDNTKALLMTRAMNEMARLGEALGGTTLTFAGLAGMGDLIVTCTSMHSRNRRAGILIGGGKSVQEAMAEIGAVVEGYYAAESACSLSRRLGLEMPICQAVYAVLYQGADPREMVGALMNRERKQETSWI
ncbi:MAG: NAD(P)H-dependent glycerol-3-phosphate dehydrogenase [Oscillospiraceae bacterium]